MTLALLVELAVHCLIHLGVLIAEPGTGEWLLSLSLNQPLLTCFPLTGMQWGRT
jgi:hypothetical protein